MSSPVHILDSQNIAYRHGGFTLIELMIVIAIIAIVLTLALPVYSNYSVRAKVGEALSVAAAAKTSASEACQDDPSIPSLSSSLAGYLFEGSLYAESVEISGPCLRPVITITTRNTGTTPSPVLVLTGDNTANSGRFRWTCSMTVGQNIHVPSTCRS
jgi:type IV pilus assembly protein PilA